MTSENPPVPELVGEMLEALRPLLARMRAERTLSPGKVGILHHLSQHARATGAELAGVLRVSPQAISLATREMEDLGYIERIPDEVDRRRSWIVLTETGQAKLQEEARTGELWMDRAIAGSLSKSEQEILKAAIPVLKKLSAVESHG